jgi:excinuclease ABC subunit C
MRHFKSIDDIIAASQEELAAVPGIPERQAREIWDYFHTSEAAPKEVVSSDL